MKRTMSFGALLVLLAAASASALEFYVAPGGNDAAPGTKERPFATLVRARDAVREAKGKAQTPVNVVLRGGTYYLEEPLRLGPEDSGTANCPVAYTAYPGEKPVISGGKVIAGWKRGPGELWTADVPEVKQGKWYFRQLFVNGQRRGRARLPARGQYPVKGPAEPRFRTFKFAPGQIDSKWRNLDDVEIVVIQWWAESRLRIESIDQTANVVRFTGDCFRSADWTDGWFAENVFEGLKEPGQWYLDRKTGVLHYWPLPDEKVEELKFVAPVARQWLRLEGDYKTGRLVEHVAFRGLKFQYSSWDMDKKLGYSYGQNSIELTPGQKLFPGWDSTNPDDERLSTPQSQVPVPSAIYAKGARHIRFEDNEIAHTGAWGIHLAPGGCKDNHIVGNSMRDLGAGAVRVGGPDPTNDDAEESGRVVITDNRIHDCGMVYFGAPAIFIGQSSGNLVAHNEITGWCEWGITLGWSWGYFPIQNARDNVVEYNHIHHYGGSPLTNHSAIYSMGVQPGTVIRYNLIRDNLSPRSNGIILDAGAAAVRVEYNVVHNVQGLGLVCNFNNFGHVIQNNIFALCGVAMTRSGDPGPLASTGAVYRNLYYYRGDKGQRLFEPDPWTNYDMVLNYNLYYDASGKPPKFLGLDFEQWKEKTSEHCKKMQWGQGKSLDCDSIVADPLFVDPRKGDFRLKPESPAFKLGFRPIDLSTVGVRPRKAIASERQH
ncbi:MAG: right-handed parallel beta-helix repeat-containing protein [Planctomycetes bacterium]|nr:right-handed parallel beta-helix repeat-containing protein [Planctomycetota bacterium]MBU4400876.1 right-handed parallel beta-helix repeat-containing protein [Planctomycetota bacterium]MCG2684736.1 right-handed parallel beta-helix repeat-containing protein [Planctomycetales bacterium]